MNWRTGEVRRLATTGTTWDLDAREPAPTGACKRSGEVVGSYAYPFRLITTGFNLRLRDCPRHRSITLERAIGWDTDSEARTEVLDRFASVAQAVFFSFAPPAEAPPQPVDAALGEFEAWYASTRTTPFWTLFEHYMPETPLVDF